MNIVLEAIESSADSGNRRIEGGYEVGALATSSRRRISECRNIIKAFIAELPDDLTVLRNPRSHRRLRRLTHHNQGADR